MQQETFEQLAITAEKGGSTFAVFTGVISFLNENAAAVGATCALFGLLIASAGFVVNFYYQKKRTDLLRTRTRMRMMMK